MNNKNRLLIFWDEQIVGTLERHQKGKVVFQYSQDWLDNPGRPISFSLPCSEKKYPPAVSTAFFENLLPENNARTILAFNHRFDKKDTFAFLENFGADCAGALSILPDGDNIDFTPGQYECINKELIEALDKIMGDPGKFTLFPEMRKARLSIAGAQDKLPVYFEGNDFYLPITSGSATTHILKPSNAGFPDIQRNETFCMELARKIGLPVPESRLIKIGAHELFVINRYDRKKTEKKLCVFIRKIFVRPWGVPADRKYQESGGPGFLQCRRIVDEFLFKQGADIRTNFARIMTFNYLIGNHDAHGKNFSILHDNEPTFAPFYDLLSTQVYPLDNKFAMAIGKTYRFERVKEHSLKGFAQDINIRPQKLVSLIDEIRQSVEKVYLPLITEHEKKYGASKIYNDLIKVIIGNLERINKICEI